MAAANAARDQGEPPPALRYAWQCRTWGALPDAGGLRDQSARLMADMPVALNAYNAMRGFWQATKGARAGAWTKDNPDGWEIVKLILKLEKERDG